MGSIGMQGQLWLGGGDREPSVDRSFSGARRLDLGHGAWLEEVRGLIAGHDALFAALERAMAWRSERRVMYDREVDVPRLLARVPDDGPGHPRISELASLLGARYLDPRSEAAFDRITLALYRDGRDSVAWHRDRDHRDRERSVVAVLTLGGARRFLVRPLRGSGSRASLATTVAGGDLMVMGGSCQRTVEHCVPKAPRADPRIAIMFRHSAPIAPLAR